jgi:hypothetical protein
MRFLQEARVWTPCLPRVSADQAWILRRQFAVSRRPGERARALPGSRLELATRERQVPSGQSGAPMSAFEPSERLTGKMGWDLIRLQAYGRAGGRPDRGSAVAADTRPRRA